MFQSIQNSRNALGLLFMLPAAILLLLFLTYPLGLGLPQVVRTMVATGDVGGIDAS